ncbi:MAG: hypothetical protein V1682_03380 [Candidatus Omnitrophota bacterium]
MRNKFTRLFICLFIFLPPARLHTAEAAQEAQAVSPAAGFTASDEANITDLQDMEKGILFLEDKLARREQDIKERADYKRVQAIEMKKCADLKSEIWALRDNVRALIVKLSKLSADKEKCLADIAKLAEIYKVSDDNSRIAAGEINDKEIQFKDEMAALGAESDIRRGRIGKLKEELRASADNTRVLQNEYNKIDGSLRSKSAEYNAEEEKLKALNDRLAAEEKESVPAKKGSSAKAGPAIKEGAPAQDESAGIKKNMDELTAIIGKLEATKQKLADKISAATTANKSRTDNIAALEKEDELKSTDLQARAEGMDKSKKEASAKIEKLKKKALLAGERLRAARVTGKTLEDDMKKAIQEKNRAEKELNAKTDGLKVRISVLLGEDEMSNPPKEIPGKSRVKKGLSRGEELTIKLDKMFEAMKDENTRLAAENKETQAKLKRAEQAATAARRKAKEVEKAPEELMAKLNKERLDAHFNLAVIYEKNGLYRDAEREYIKCLRIDPKDPGVHYNMGILYDDKLNNNNKAMYHYNRFLALRPMGDTAERVRDWITKLELENRLGKEVR